MGEVKRGGEMEETDGLKKERTKGGGKEGGGETGEARREEARREE